tara:strand:+ start:1966 stop:3270 length:1305 start_codon:yes stop_codon:yes gene_type:complete
LKINSYVCKMSPFLFKFSVIAFVTLFLLNISLLRADFFLTQWPYYKDIIIDENKLDDKIIEVKIDSQIYKKSDIDLKDLRIVEDNKYETPYSMQVKSGLSSEKYLNSKIVENSFLKNQFNTVIVDLGTLTTIHNQVNIISLSENFSRKVSIESSIDKNQWKKIGSGEISAFRNNDISFRDTVVQYLDSKSQFLRIKVEDGGKGELSISDIEVVFSKEIPAEETSWDILNSNIVNDKNLSLTTVSLDLGFEGIPSSKILIKAETENFYRLVDVKASTDKRNWEKIVNKQPIFSFSDGGSLIIDNVIEYPEIKKRFIEIVIYNQDDLPLNVLEPNIIGVNRSVIFKGDLGHMYRLYYGNLNAKNVSYDIKYFFENIDTRNSYKAILGIEQENIFFLDNLSIFDRHSWLMPGILFLTASILAIIIVITIRRIKLYTS